MPQHRLKMAYHVARPSEQEKRVVMLCFAAEGWQAVGSHRLNSRLLSFSRQRQNVCNIFGPLAPVIWTGSPLVSSTLIITTTTTTQPLSDIVYSSKSFWTSQLSFPGVYLLTHSLTYLLLTYLLTYLLTHSPHSFTHSMEQSPSWESNRFSRSQEIPCVLWNPKVH